MTHPISPTLGYLLMHYGPLLTLKQLAEVLHSTPGATRMVIRREQAPLAVALARAERPLGRRLYFDATRVAAVIEGISGPSAETPVNDSNGTG